MSDTDQTTAQTGDISSADYRARRFTLLPMRTRPLIIGGRNVFKIWQAACVVCQMLYS
jgi:hypothetical protein